jgi:demethylmenaquinone methyltransferase/2-methoxy-6-polyprenyl-1,4-benzoquinol methylase
MERDLAAVPRVTRSKAQAQTAYDQMSGWYGLLTDPFEGRYRQQGLTWLKPKAGERLLEIGPGPGQTLVALAQQGGPSGHIVGLDISMGMLRQAKLRLRRQGVFSTTSLLQGDGASLPCSGGSFDGLFLCFTLELFDNPEIPVVLQECRRVLKPGGRMVVVSMVQQHSTSLMTHLYLGFRRLLPQYADCRPIWLQPAVEAAGFQAAERADFTMFGLPGAMLLALNPA